MSELARLAVERRDAVVVARVDGEIDMSNAGEIGRALAGAVPNGAAGLVVDLSGVDYLDSAGVRLVFQLAERLRLGQQALRLVVPSGAPILEVLELTGVPAHVACDLSVEDAVGAIG